MLRYCNDMDRVHECTVWMSSRGWSPMDFQLEAWKQYSLGSSGLVNAPTGSGKTYSLLLPAMLEIQQRNPGTGLRLIWIIPIRALAKEIHRAALRIAESIAFDVSVGVRTGDTDPAERSRQRIKMPDILITTPESLHLILALRDSRKWLSQVQTIVADEWHELMGTKRGVQVELAMSRIRSFSPEVRIWGISATIGNMQDAMSMLLGPFHAGRGVFIRSMLRKKIDVISLVPDDLSALPWAGHLGIRMLSKILPVINAGKTTLLFTNTRAQCEIWYRHLLEAEPSLAGQMAMHHGSISREQRHWVEEALTEHRLKVVVCTSSLDLGVDFAPVDTIIQVGGPKGVGRFLQRAGRSGHKPGQVSRIYFVPVNALELLEAAALKQAVRDQLVEDRIPLVRCFDVLVQYLVTLSLGEGFEEEEVYHQVMGTCCFCGMDIKEWKWMIDFVSTGGASLGAYNEYHRIVMKNSRWTIANQRLARRHRLSIGTIVADPSVAVRFVRGGLVGHIEESFIGSLNEGDHFWFAGQGLELVRIRELTAYVKKSTTMTGRIPSWQGGRLPLSSRMSAMLKRKMEEAASGSDNLDSELLALGPLLDIQRQRSHVPISSELLIESFRSDEGHHLFVYPFEGRFVHEGMAALFAYRLSRVRPITLSMAYNDYGFELLSDQAIPLAEAMNAGLLMAEKCEEDLLRAINANELTRRKFREIAAISGLIFKGYPGQPVKDRHLQSSAGLIYQVLEEYDSENLLIRQSIDEVLMAQLEMGRIQLFMKNLQRMKVIHRELNAVTPFSFPIIVDRLRERLTSEALGDRIKRMELNYGD